MVPLGTHGPVTHGATYFDFAPLRSAALSMTEANHFHIPYSIVP